MSDVFVASSSAVQALDEVCLSHAYALHACLVAGNTPPREALEWLGENTSRELHAGLERENTATACKDAPALAGRVVNLIAQLHTDLQRTADGTLDAACTVLLEARGREAPSIEYHQTSGQLGWREAREQLHTRVRALVSFDAWNAMLYRARGDADAAVAHEVAETVARALREVEEDWSARRELLRSLCKCMGVRCDEAALQQCLGGHADATTRDLMDAVSLDAIDPLLEALGQRDPSHATDETRPRGVGDEVPTEQLRPLQEVNKGARSSEVVGVHHSDELTRMLASESVLLRHPTLRMLFQARRVERRLQTWQLEGFDTRPVPVVTRGAARGDHRAPRATRGPMVVFFDTSGSMTLHEYERTAKRLALRACEFAQRDARPCSLVNFSSAHQWVEHRVRYTPQGMLELVAWMRTSFHGGTELDDALRHALTHKRDAFRDADLLVISDGKFGIDPDTVALMKRHSENEDTRFHIVLLSEPNAPHVHTLENAWIDRLGFTHVRVVMTPA